MSNQSPFIKLMPAIFIGHGSPMNAIENNEFSRSWIKIGKSFPKPKAILSISAHWEQNGTFLTAMDHPKTIYDFYGFPEELYKIQYSAPGALKFAELTKNVLKKTDVKLDYNWGLDHGTWIVLKNMYPNADVPTFQLSLDYTKPPVFHYSLGQELKSLRKEDILIMGSGNIVHNLGLRSEEPYAYKWAIEFDNRIKEFILNHDHKSIINYEQRDKLASLAIPTNEHYLPLLYILGVQDDKDKVTFECEKIIYGSISMRCLILQ